MNWQPEQSYLKWGKNLLASMTDGAIWKIPATENTYIISHSKQELQLITGHLDDWHEKNKILFATFGYKVIDCRHLPRETKKTIEVQLTALNITDDLDEIIPGMIEQCLETGKGFLLTVNGFDDDPRELSDIPEVIAFFGKLFSSGLASCLEFSSVATSLEQGLGTSGFGALGALEVWAAWKGLTKQDELTESQRVQFLDDYLSAKSKIKPSGKEIPEGQTKIKRFEGNK